MAGRGAGAGSGVGPGRGGMTAASRLVGDYQLGDPIGKGGFGTVFKGLNIKTGDFVAVKRLSLRSVDPDEIESMQSEINLLKRLKHPNIVKYVDTVQTSDFLHIILEYVDCGSLSHTIKKFGAFSEPLAAMYIAQVLEGLEYLHEQGVIHRDIKGANILITKQGVVKLADFGVAITTAQKSNTVVGSPYWMAPEIIEMAGTSTACDIWSVGCTVVELMTGKPPYFDLRPMTALFRIVSDEYPPLPDHISEAMRDFLRLCFKKTPAQRQDATQLLTHPWINSRLRRVRPEGMKPADLLPGGGVKGEGTKAEFEEFSETVTNTIKYHTQRLLKEAMDKARAEEVPTSTPTPAPPPAPPRVASRGRGLPTSSPGSGLEALVEASDDEADFGADLDLTGFDAPGDGEIPDEAAASPVDDGDWGSDDDFGSDSGDSKLDSEVGPSLGGSAAVHLSMFQEQDEDDDWGDVNVGDAFPDAVAEEATDDPFGSDSDDSNDAWGSDDDGPAVTPAGADTGSLLMTTAVDHTVQLSHLADDDDDADWGFGDDDDDNDDGLGDMVVTQAPSDDVPGTVDELRARMASQMRARTAGNAADDDPFGALESDDEDEAHDLASRQQRQIMTLVSRMSPDERPEAIVEVCEEMVRLLLDSPAHRRHIIPNHGVLPFVDVLEVSDTCPEVLCAVIRVVNIITEERRLQEAVSLVGALPAILHFTRPTFPVEVRFLTAVLVEQLCASAAVPLQMFVACGGLRVLVNLMTPTDDGAGMRVGGTALWDDAVDGPALAKLKVSSPEAALRRVGLKSMPAVFRLQTVPKNDFCRLFVKAGVLDGLLTSLRNVKHVIVTAHTHRHGAGESSGPQPGALTEAYSDLHLIADMAVAFCQSDSHVTNAVAEHGFLNGLLRVLRPVIPSLVEQPRYERVVVKVLKALKHLSMEPGTLPALQRAGAISTLVPFLEVTESPQQKDIHNHVVHAMFNLCKVNKPRQEAACFAGIVPFLQRIINENSPLKQLALPLLFDMAHNVRSRRVRDELWRNNTVEFYYQLLGEHYWKIHALNSISVCLQHDADRVQTIMLRPKNINALIELFRTQQRVVFNSLLAPLQNMLERCPRLARALGHSLFVAELVHRLAERKAIVLTSLLKMVLCIYENATTPWDLLLEYGLVAKVTALAEDDRMVVVQEIARRLLAVFQPMLLAKVSSSLSW